MTVWAVDPGDEHVGLATWPGYGPWEATEVPSGAFPRKLADAAQENRDWGVGFVVVCEEFVLYPWAATQQSWSPMRTSEMIGQIRWICNEAGAELVMQGADIKKPTAAQCRGRGIRRVGVGDHARDAELHLIYHLLRQDLMLNTLLDRNGKRIV